MEIKLGSLVKSSYHPYDRDMICTVDRIYTKNNKGHRPQIMCRLDYKYKNEDRLFTLG